MVSLETTPAQIGESKPRIGRKILYVVAGLGLAAAFLAMRTGAHPLERRLLGAWELRNTPSFTSDERIIEFRDDGHCWIYRKGKRDVEAEIFDWDISKGDLVFVFDDPLSQKNASTGKRLAEIFRRVADPLNSARSYRYSVKDDGGETLTMALAKERGNSPAQAERATLKRVAKQPSP